MDVIAQFFTDPLLNSDAVRQARAIRCLQESRNGQAALIEEVADLADFLQIVSLNLQQKFLLIKEKKQPVFDELLTLIIPEANRQFKDNILQYEILNTTKQSDPSLLVDPLIDFLTDYLANGIFCESQTFVFHKSGIQEMFWEFGNLIFNILPKSMIMNTSVEPDQVNLSDAENAFTKCIIDGIGVLCSLLKLSDAINDYAKQPIELTTDKRVFKAMEVKQLMKIITANVLPFIGRLLQVLNQHVFSKDNHQQLPEYRIPMRIIEPLQISIMYFFQLLYLQDPKLVVPEVQVLDLISDSLERDLNSRFVGIALNILQSVDFKSQSMNYLTLACRCSKLLFRGGGLKVSTKHQADCQLALLNVICRASQTQNSFVVGLCQSFDSQVNFDVKPVISTKTAKITGTQIIEAESDSELEVQQKDLIPRENETVEQKSVKRNESSDSIASNNGSENPFLRNRKAQKSRAKSPALAKTIRKEPEITFVENYLLNFFRLYGNNQFHSSRSLQIYLQKQLKELPAIRTGIIEGHKVNYEQLNIERVAKMNDKTLAFKQNKEQQKERDEQENQRIMKSTKYHSIAMNKLVQAEQDREIRDKERFRDFSKDIKRETTYSFNVEMEKNDQFMRNTTQNVKPLMSTAQLLQGIDGQYEMYFIYYNLRILANVFHLSKNLPSRQIRQVISNMEAKFVTGIVYFIDKDSFLTGPALQLIYDILTFPQMQSGNTVFLDQWEIFFNNGLLEFVNRVNQTKQLYGAIFVCKLLQGAEFSEFIPDNRLQEMCVKLINSFIILFSTIIGSGVSDTAEIALQAIAFLCCCYGTKFGTLVDYIDQENIDRLNIKLLEIFNHHGHFLSYPAILVVYGLYGMSKREQYARLAYDSGLLKSIMDMFILRHENPKEFINQTDIVVIRFFSDVCQIGDRRLHDYLQTRSDFSAAMIQMYRFWQQSLERKPADDTQVVLQKAEMVQPKEIVSRINVFEIAGVQLQNIDDRVVKDECHTVLSPTRARQNVLEIQSSIKQGLEVKESLRPPPIQSKFVKGEAPASYCDIPEDARYLLKLNVTNTVLGYFRSLYPNLSLHQCLVKATCDVTKLPKTGKLSVRRPTSGTTPKIGMRVPCLLPNLGQKSEAVINECEVILSQEDVLVLLQLMGQGLKESLVQLMLGDSEELIKDDREFLKQATAYIEDRVSVLQRSGQRVADQLRQDKIQDEVDFYQTVRK